MAEKLSNDKTKSVDGNTEQALEIIAANTMCVREAAGAIAKIAIAWITSFVAIAIAVAILSVNPVNTSNSPTGVHWVCFGVIIIFGLYAVIYPAISMSELNRTIKRVREAEERIFEGDKGND